MNKRSSLLFAIIISHVTQSSYDDFNDIIPTFRWRIHCASMSSDGDLTTNHGDEDVWVAKLDRHGKIQCNRTMEASMGTMEIT